MTILYRHRSAANYVGSIGSKRIRGESHLLDLSAQGCRLRSPDITKSDEDSQEPTFHLAAHSIPLSVSLAEEERRSDDRPPVAPAAATAPDVWRLQKHEMVHLIGAVVLALLWYGTLWLAG
jgi:hypothetical protein